MDKVCVKTVARLRTMGGERAGARRQGPQECRVGVGVRIGHAAAVRWALRPEKRCLMGSFAGKLCPA